MCAIDSVLLREESRVVTFTVFPLPISARIFSPTRIQRIDPVGARLCECVSATVPDSVLVQQIVNTSRDPARIVCGSFHCVLATKKYSKKVLFLVQF